MTDICKCICHTLNDELSKIVSLNCFCCETCPKCLQHSVDDEHIENCNIVSLLNYKRN
jgi:hypothetical protein